MSADLGLRHSLVELKRTAQLTALPPRVARFQWRARRVARRTGDEFLLGSATRPADLSRLLRLAAGRRCVAELGTAGGWTAISLALADAGRQVVTFDPLDHSQRLHYLDLIDSSVRRRIQFFAAPGSSGPPPGMIVELLYIDSAHGREETIAELRAWSPALPAGALVVLDDYDHPAYPGVREAVETLGLSGRQRGTLFVHEVASSPVRQDG
jgi:predicted O-methyltransferase YrrM